MCSFLFIFPSLFLFPASPFSFSFSNSFFMSCFLLFVAHTRDQGTEFTKTNINALLWKILKAKRLRSPVHSIERMRYTLEGSKGGAALVLGGQDPIILYTYMKVRRRVLKRLNRSFWRSRRLYVYSRLYVQCNQFCIQNTNLIFWRTVTKRNTRKGFTITCSIWEYVERCLVPLMVWRWNTRRMYHLGYVGGVLCMKYIEHEVSWGWKTFMYLRTPERSMLCNEDDCVCIAGVFNARRLFAPGILCINNYEPAYWTDLLPPLPSLPQPWIRAGWSRASLHKQKR